MKNNENTFYTCPYCGKEYSEPVDLAHCILSCEELKKQKEAEEKQKKRDAEKAARYKEIEDEAKKLGEMIKAYSKEYGKFSFTRDYAKEDYPINYLWNKLFF